MFLGIFITVTPCHVVNLKSAVRVIYGYSKKSCWFLKGVIRLDVYLLVIFTSYYETQMFPWKVVANSMSSCL